MRAARQEQRDFLSSKRQPSFFDRSLSGTPKVPSPLASSRLQLSPFRKARGSASGLITSLHWGVQTKGSKGYLHARNLLS